MQCCIGENMEKTVISSKENKLIKAYKKLVSSKKLRNESQKFVLEGKRLVVDAFINKIEFENIFVTETAYRKYYDDICSFEDECILIDDKIGEILSETENSQGIFAICRQPKIYDLDTLFKNGGNFIVLSQLQDPGNVGTILRTADALSIDAVIFCQSCEMFSPKTVRSAMGAAFRVKTANVSSYEEIIAKCREYNIVTYGAVLDKNSVSIKDINFENNHNAVWIGNEGNGLLPEIYTKLDHTAIIPMNSCAESLNAAMAAGIFIWEMNKNRVK
jgi:TrmH family RNA methyltransferase